MATSNRGLVSSEGRQTEEVSQLRALNRFGVARTSAKISTGQRHRLGSLKRRAGLRRAVRSLFEPGALRRAGAKAILGRIGSLPYETKINFETMPYPQYAYGTYYAALQAKALGLTEISVIEFGVAGGNGLVALEEIAVEVEAATGVGVRSYGFDLGAGMPAATDFRDLPYVWKQGFFNMDVERLASRLRRTQLVLGDVAETVGAFATDDAVAPIGFISFDLDYYSSTKSAFELLRLQNSKFLPRTYCYFDDCIGNDWELHSQFTGELLLISEFNGESEQRKLGKINGLRHKLVFDSRWQDVMYVLHSFDHPDYNRYINPRGNRWELPLADD